MRIERASSKMQCKLCDSEAKLVRSHIIPEFFYRHTYDENSRAIELTLDKFKKRPIQVGYREYLLCRACDEELIGKTESYVADIWYNNSQLPERIYSDHYEIDVDYSKFKLFLLSVLWRASVSRKFEEVRLGPKHETKIKQMLLNQDPGPEEAYVVLASLLVDKGKIKHGIVCQPASGKLPSGHHSYYFVFGGCEWYFIVSSHSHRDFPRSSLVKDGKLACWSRIFGNPMR